MGTFQVLKFWALALLGSSPNLKAFAQNIASGSQQSVDPKGASDPDEHQTSARVSCVSLQYRTPEKNLEPRPHAYPLHWEVNGKM